MLASASQVSSVNTGQLFTACGSPVRFQRQSADVNPRLKMTGGGLQHDAWLMTIGSHRFENRRRGPIQIEQNAAGVLVLCVGPDVGMKTLAIANEQKPDGGRRILRNETHSPRSKPAVRSGFGCREKAPCTGRLSKRPEGLPGFRTAPRETAPIPATPNSENQLASGSQKERSFFSFCECFTLQRAEPKICLMSIQ